MEPQSICLLSASVSVQGHLHSPVLISMLKIMRQSQTEQDFLENPSPMLAVKQIEIIWQMKKYFIYILSLILFNNAYILNKCIMKVYLGIPSELCPSVQSSTVISG